MGNSSGDNGQYDTLARMTSYNDEIHGVMYKDGEVQIEIASYLAALAPAIRIGRNRFYVENDNGRAGHFSMTKGRMCLDGFLDVFGYREDFVDFSTSMFVMYAKEADWVLVTMTAPATALQARRDALIDIFSAATNNDTSMLVALKSNVTEYLEAMRKQRPNELTWSNF